MGRRARERTRAGDTPANTTGAARPPAARKAGTRAKKAGARRRSSGRVRWAVGIAVAALAVVAFRALPGAASGTVARVGAEAPDLNVRTLDGQKVSLAALRGKVVLVNFWATWCPPCRAEMPGFEAVWRDRQKDGFVVLGLSADEGGSGEVAMFLGDRGITYPVAMASASAKRSFGGVNALPSSFLIDKQGRVRRQVAGVFDERLLRQDVNRLLAE